LCQERARFLLEQREEERREAELAREQEMKREERRDDQRMMAAAIREPTSACRWRWWTCDARRSWTNPSAPPPPRHPQSF
jgi:hypothetical protein